MYSLEYTNRFKKDVKRCQKRGLDINLLMTAIKILVEKGSLPESYKPHKLVGKNFSDKWECHIQPDWLLVWEQHDDQLLMIMTNTGSHSDLF